MSTIAWDGKTLATDSYISQGDIITQKEGTKLFLDVGDYHVAAMAGLLVPLHDFIIWLGGDKEETHPKGSGEVVVMDKNGKVYSFYPEDSCSPTESRTFPYACGSGRELAIGAMEAGATAIQAVHIASLRDPFTGGEIKSYTFE